MDLQALLVSLQLWDHVLEVLDTRVKLEFHANSWEAHNFQPLKRKQISFRDNIQAISILICLNLTPHISVTFQNIVY